MRFNYYLPSFFHFGFKESTMMKFAVCAAVLASASAFAPVQQSARTSVELNAERSKALPFMNRPPLVSYRYETTSTAQINGSYIGIDTVYFSNATWYGFFLPV